MFGGQLADLVMPLAYAYRRSDENRGRIGRHQSEHHMWGYKNDPPAQGCVTDLTVMLLAATLFHQSCAAAHVGSPWHCWAVVPSSRRVRSAGHPLARIVQSSGLSIEQVHLALNGSPSDDRLVRPDRFTVSQSTSVAGRHVLLIEDTWVSGASAQSAVMALKRADASAVTVLCLARWLSEDPDWPIERDFFEGLDTPYDPLMCPVLGGLCSGPSSRG